MHAVMKRIPSLRFGVVGALALGFCATLGAQVAPEARRPEQKAPPPKRHVLSPEVAAQLSAATPKFAPAPAAPTPKPQEEQPDMREIDKPRNGIVRLDPVIVQERRNPVLNERAITTDRGLTDIAVRRYISETDKALNRFSLPLFSGWSTEPGSSTEKRALAMYADDERLNNMSELRADAVAASKSDPVAAEQIRRESQQTFMRQSDFGWSKPK